MMLWCRVGGVCERNSDELWEKLKSQPFAIENKSRMKFSTNLTTAIGKFSRKFQSESQRSAKILCGTSRFKLDWFVVENQRVSSRISLQNRRQSFANESRHEIRRIIAIPAKFISKLSSWKKEIDAQEFTRLLNSVKAAGVWYRQEHGARIQVKRFSGHLKQSRRHQLEDIESKMWRAPRVQRVSVFRQEN